MTAGGATKPCRDVRRDVAAIVGGLAVLGLGMLLVRNGTVSGAEESVFRVVNDRPDWLYRVAWPFQQLGALVLGPAVAVVALVLRRYRLAVAALVVTFLKLASERAVKALSSRQRPYTSIGSDVELRGDVPESGESFVSGHAVLVAALAGVVTPYLPGRWKIVPWALVGAVMLGRVYVGAHNPLDVICGAALLGVAIAGAVNLALLPRCRAPAIDDEADNSPRPDDAGGRRHQGADVVRLAGTAIAGCVGLIAIVGCGPAATHDSAPRSLADDVITIGSFDFAESVAVAEAYSQGLEAAGYEVERAFSLGPREFVGPALANGLVELVPEYAGTAAEFHSLGAAAPTDDVAATHAELEQALRGVPVVALAPAPAQDANAFVVTRATAQRLHLAVVSDLAGLGDELIFGGPAECPTRLLCLAGLADVYDTSFGGFVALDAGGPLTRQALLQGDVDVALLFTTDPAIEALDLVELTDDRGLQPAENITPLLRTEIVERWGSAVVDTIDAVSARLTTESVRDLNRAVADLEAPDPASIAAVVAVWWSEAVS